MSKNLMDQSAKERIMSAEAKANGGKVESGGFAAKAQAIADKRAYEANTGGHGQANCQGGNHAHGGKK